MMTRSPQSGPPSPPNDPKRSTTSWATPEPGDVLSYAYLWDREARAGQEEGLKDRPSVVVVAQRIVNDRLQLMVAPITHSPPVRPEEAIEIPQRVKRHLGLDAERSWIMTTELNRFIWPGPDIRMIDGRTPLYGALPAVLFDQIKARILERAQSNRVGVVKRTD